MFRGDKLISLFIIGSQLLYVPGGYAQGNPPARTPGGARDNRDSVADRNLRRDEIAAREREQQRLAGIEAQRLRAQFADTKARLEAEAAERTERKFKEKVAAFLPSYENDPEKGTFLTAALGAEVLAPKPKVKEGAATTPTAATSQQPLVVQTVQDWGNRFRQLSEGATFLSGVGDTAQKAFVGPPPTDGKFDAKALGLSVRGTNEFKDITNFVSLTDAIGISTSQFSDSGAKTVATAAVRLATRVDLTDVEGAPGPDDGDGGHEGNTQRERDVLDALRSKLSPELRTRLEFRSNSDASERLRDVSKDAATLATESIAIATAEEAKLKEEIEKARDALNDALAANGAGGGGAGEGGDEQPTAGTGGGGGGGTGGGGEGGGAGGGAAGGSDIPFLTGLTPFNADIPKADATDLSYMPDTYGISNAITKSQNSGISPDKLNSLPLEKIPQFAYQSGLGSKGGVNGPVSDFFNSGASAGSSIGGGAANPGEPTQADGGGQNGAAGMSGGSKGADNLSGGVFDGVNPGYEPGDPPLNAEKIVGFGEGSSNSNEGGDLIGLAKKDGDGVPGGGALGGPGALQLLANAPSNPQDPRQAKHILFYMGYLRREPCRDYRAASIGICVNVKPGAKETASIAQIASAEPARREPASVRGIPVVDKARAAAARGKR